MKNSNRAAASPSSAEPTDEERGQPGTVAHTVARLARWGRLAPQGLARVEFDSAFAQQRVATVLRETFRAAGIPFHEIELPANTPAVELVRDLVERLRG